LSLGLFLFAIIQIVYIFVTRQILQYSLGALIGLVLSLISVKRSSLYKSWYTRGIFEQALHYGNDIEKMFKDEWPEDKVTTPARRKPRAKTKASTRSSNTTTTKTSATKKKAT
jgi:hypothetical protein